MMNFLHTFNPQPFLFEYGWFKIHWYGIFIVLGILAGLALVLVLAKKVKISQDEVFDLGFYAVVASLFGARVYAVCLDLDYYFQFPFEMIAVWHGGLAIHGAIIGGVAAGLIYCFKKGLSFWQWSDLIAPALALGQAIGRWGNYFNQELFGRPTDLPWGIPIELKNRPLEFLSKQYYHPTFIYESVLNLLNCIVLVLVFLWVYRGVGKVGKLGRVSARGGSVFDGGKLGDLAGVVFLVYLINYSLIRIAMESLRLDPAPELFGVRWPVVMSGVLLAVGGVLLIGRVIKLAGK